MAEVQLIDILYRQICYVLLCTYFCFVFQNIAILPSSDLLTSGLYEAGGLSGGGGQLNHYLGVIYLAV